MTATRPPSRLSHPRSAVLLAFVLLCLLPAEPASAYAQPPNFTVLGWAQGPVWSNYDENQALSGGAQLRDADWPIDVLVWNFADVNRVKNAMGNFYGPRDGGTKWLNIWTSYPAGETHDRDDGKKTPDAGSGCNRYNLHYRVYAPPSVDAFYMTGWGYFVVISNHYDINENCANELFGFSENAENLFVAAASMNGFPVQNDSMYHYNDFCYPAYCQDGNHAWLNDGYASLVNFNILP